MPQDLIDQFDDKPTLLQVMAWCHHARSHYLNLCPLRHVLRDWATMSLAPYADFRIVLASLKGHLVDRENQMGDCQFPWPPFPV